MSTEQPRWPAPESGPPAAAAGRYRKFRCSLLVLVGFAAAVSVILFAAQRAVGPMSHYELGPRSAFTPEQAKGQAIDAAREIVSVAGIAATKGVVYLSSCNDQGEAPFRGDVVVHYTLAPSPQDAQNDTASYLRALEASGWAVLPGPYLGRPPISAEKNGVTVRFEVQGGGRSGRVLTVLGECRDVTTTKDTVPGGEPIPGL